MGWQIFQAMTVPDIVHAVFRDLGFTDFESKLSGTYRTWDYCVQYRETDLNFVSRLMEQEGIYYFFEHVDGKHTLILANDYSSHALLSGYEEVPYYPPQSQTRRERDYIDQWAISRQVQPGAYALRDYHFETPQADLTVRQTVARKHAVAAQEVFDYTSAKTADAQRYAAYFRALLERGVYFAPSQFEAGFISAAHTAQDIDDTLAAASEALAEI